VERAFVHVDYEVSHKPVGWLRSFAFLGSYWLNHRNIGSKSSTNLMVSCDHFSNSVSLVRQHLPARYANRDKIFQSTPQARFYVTKLT
jgi:hypothetical protein